VLLLIRCSSRLPLLDNVSPPESPGDATAVEVVAPSLVVMAGDEASRLQAQFEAVQEATTGSEWQAACAMASHAEA
jgi:hypothetical protein